MHAYVLLLLIGAVYASDIIEGEYLLGLESEYDSDILAMQLEQEFGLKMVRDWDIDSSKILFLVGDKNVDQARIAQLPGVRYMSNNGRMYEDQSCVIKSCPGTWGLDRTDQRPALPYNSPEEPSAVYEQGMFPGDGVNVYVVDGGIDVDHYTYGGRAVFGYLAFDTPMDTGYGTGHGTHTSGTIGSADWGIAKNVSLIAVKVTDQNGSGSVAGFVDGLAWIRNDTRHEPGVDRTVVSASLGYNGFQETIHDIVTQMFSEGVNFAVSAGNDDGDACQQSPAHVPVAITVAATDVNDLTADFTSYGSCVDIHAPGVDVLSAAPLNSTDIKSGTSMSAPHVAGVIARYLSTTTGPPPSPQEVTDWLLAAATVDAVRFSDPDHSSSPNLLLYGGCSQEASPKN